LATAVMEMTAAYRASGLVLWPIAAVEQSQEKVTPE